ncbi:MAG: membrane protein insertase YidC [Gammaproteobacteria bacterium]
MFLRQKNIRWFLLIAFCWVSSTLYFEWQKTHAPTPNNLQLSSKQQPNSDSVDLPPQNIAVGASDVPHLAPEAPNKADQTPSTAQQEVQELIDPRRLVQVKTDNFLIKIDKLGGDIVEAILLKYPQSKQKPDQGFVFLSKKGLKNNSDIDREYFFQTGFVSNFGPDSREKGRSLYESAASNYVLESGSKTLEVPLVWKNEQGLTVKKIFIFNQEAYAIKIRYEIENKSNQPYKGSAYARIKRTQPAEQSSFLGVQTFTGMALNDLEKPYKKLQFKDVNQLEEKVKRTAGWAAMIEHYFVSALIGEKEQENQYQAKSFGNNWYGVELINPVLEIAPNTKATTALGLYLGPEITKDLKLLAQDLELTVDYGILWPLCQPIFWALKAINSFFGNWGVSIILVTVLIKIAFFKLSASSFKSMGKMKKLQPKIEALKQTYGEDKQRFSQAIMELYKKEKVNPVGGCLPMLVQIPVFISLYYVLLGSVELRQAEFMWWITDLSIKDPYYVLPIIMGASMFLQQKISPAPADPVQAKVMMLMPVFFTFLFLQFPAGLVLYWIVNNFLSIAQQTYISKRYA